MKLGRTIQTAGLVALAAVLTLMLLAPANASAQLTINHVRVTLTQANPTRVSVYCDTGTGASCGAAAADGNAIWDPAHGFPLTGVKLFGGDSLVLTQTGTIAVSFGSNFDTSDAVHKDGSEGNCSAARPCATKIEIDTGGGFVVVYNDATGSNPLTAFNHGKFPQETSPYSGVTIPAGLAYTLAIGYADNVHPAPCPATGCFPNPFNGKLGTTPATVFVGAGINGAAQCDSGNIPDNCFDAGAVLITALSEEGRMTGGGSIFKADGTRVTHGFELHCNILELPNNLEINWDGGNNFHLDALTKVTCSDDPKIDQGHPDAGFDTYVGEGTGSYNGVPGATISFLLTDAGEPGTKDTAAYVIKVGATTVLSVGPANLNRGNQQAHKD